MKTRFYVSTTKKSLTINVPQYSNLNSKFCKSQLQLVLMISNWNTFFPLSLKRDRYFCFIRLSSNE